MEPSPSKEDGPGSINYEPAVDGLPHLIVGCPKCWMFPPSGSTAVSKSTSSLSPRRGAGRSRRWRSYRPWTSIHRLLLPRISDRSVQVQEGTTGVVMREHPNSKLPL